MPQARHIQTSLTSGELDPLLWSREDITFFYTSARLIENAVPLPQGGVKRREGWVYKAPQRGELDELTISALTAPNGGTTANLTDGDEDTVFTTTTAMGTVGTYEIVIIDLGSSMDVTCVDMGGIAIVGVDGTVNSARLQLHASDDASTWELIAADTFATATHDRRFSAPPDQLLTTARYLRIRTSNFIAGQDYGASTVRMTSVAVHVEEGYSTDGAEVGNHSHHTMTTSIDDEYDLVMTDGNCDIFSGDDGSYLASVSLPHPNSRIGEIKVSQSLDTMVVYHENYPPWVIQKIGGDTSWRSGAFEFESVVDFPFDTLDGEDVSGGENEIQFAQFSDMAGTDDLLVEYNGETSASFSWTNTTATMVTRIQNAINSLTDFSEVVVTDAGDDGFDIEFTGVDGKRAWPTLVFDLLTGSGLVEISRKTYGKPDTDKLWSDTRGYPRCGGFYQGRHWMGGFRDRSDVIVASRAGNLADFREDADPVISSPIVVAPSLDEQITVHNIYAGRHLQIFTSSAELYVPDEPITIDNIALKVTTRHGSNRYTQPVDVQGGTLFVDRNGRALREYLFTDAEQSYSAEPVTILAGHLLASPQSMVLRRARDVDQPRALLIANTGTDRAGDTVPASMCIIDRAQQVTGLCRISTEGTPLTFASTQKGEAFAMVSRELAGNSWNFLEQFSSDFMSDCAVEVANDDIDDLTATADQTVFSYTFTSPLDTSDVAIWTRASEDDDWSRVEGDSYTVQLDTQTVTLTGDYADGVAEGTLVRVNLRQDTVTLSGVGDHLEGVEVEVHGDGLPLGTLTVSGGAVDLGDQRFDFACQVGLRMIPRIVLHPYKGQGQQSPTMKNQRIPRMLLQLERTGAVSVSAHDGGRPRAVSLANYDSGVMDPTLDEVLFTGAKRISGLGRWQKEPTVEITQTVPMPFLLRSVTYDVRF